MSENPTLKPCAILVDFVSRHAMLAVAGLAVSLAVATGPASAQPPGKGPRASLLSSTTCALDLGNVAADGPGPGWVVTTTLTNKSSGDGVIPEVRQYGDDGTESVIQATRKPKSQPGNTYDMWADAFINDLVDDLTTTEKETLPVDVNPSLDFVAYFPLCDLTGEALNAKAMVKDAVQDVRELNATSTINYGISGGDGETRTVTNRCTDNPDTLDNEGGMKVDAVTLYLIGMACDAWADAIKQASEPVAPVSTQTQTTVTTAVSSVEPTPSDSPTDTTTTTTDTTDTTATTESTTDTTTTTTGL